MKDREGATRTVQIYEDQWTPTTLVWKEATEQDLTKHSGMNQFLVTLAYAAQKRVKRVQENMSIKGREERNAEG